MPTKCYAQVRGHVIRVTRLDACGIPKPGESAVAVSKRISSVSIDVEMEDGENIRETNFSGEPCVVDNAPAHLIGYSGEITLCGVDPDLISIFTGTPVVKNAAGDVVGFDATSDINLDSFGFALEVWSRISGTACDASGNRPWGYTVFPFFKGGHLGGFSFENGAVQFQITGAMTQNGNGWGAGPYNVDRGTGGAPSPLFTPLTPNTHYRNVQVTLDPPVATCGAVALPPRA